MNDDFAEAYSVTTGRKQNVPRVWIGDPILGRDLRKTPLQIAADAMAAGSVPAEDWTKTQLEDFAAAQGIDLGEAKVKAEVWKAIDAVLAVGRAEMARTETASGVPEHTSQVLYADQLEQQAVLLAQQAEQIAQLTAELDAATTPKSPDTDPVADQQNATPSSTDTPAAGDKEN